MTWLREIFLVLFRFWGGRLTALHLKRRGLVVYLRALQAARRSLLAVVAFVCLLQLMVLGAVGAFVVGVLLTSQDWTAKLWMLLAGFLAILVLPFIGLAVLFSERLWFKLSGAESYFKSTEAPSQPAATNINSGDLFCK